MTDDVIKTGDRVLIRMNNINKYGQVTRINKKKKTADVQIDGKYFSEEFSLRFLESIKRWTILDDETGGI